ncbi:PVC-type heme-binding CxxCH protein [Gimesia sp.]|uniref:PVC-type heme-binding CxxCH protein n=1 Tax=Gimesia sp. TaxID=2024833 RepID=UPI003A954AB5
MRVEAVADSPAFFLVRLAVLTFLVCLTQEDDCSAQGFPPEEAVRRMTVAEGFEVELAAAEPLVRQPVAIDFDDRGRLWVLQYLQYPNPAGLKRVKVDRFSRTTYDRIPAPPPTGPKGADRLTILEDTNGDGRYDKARDFISDLNIASGFACGYGGVFVLQTPYLLFYPDRNRDDIPDGDPEVLLKGFGMEDTSSVANSLIWGPDGWLYGTQGTNITANIRGIEFEQGIWRYHPVSRKFELFMEGGGNMWGLDFDQSGNLLAGTNYGGYLMFHVRQGAYYEKSFAKHGELHNPFALGYFQHVPHKKFQGGHVTVGGFLYQSDQFPAQYRNKYMAVDTLGHAVRWHHTLPDQSTFRSENGGVLLQANDTWFAPSDAVQGPDGAVYIADWHDQRTAHPDPDANWDRRNGRVYRIRSQSAKPYQHVDPQALTSAQLVDLLSSSNEWQVRRARRILSERRDAQVIETLRTLSQNPDDQKLALQALWTLNAMGAFDQTQEGSLLAHQDPHIREWTIRLIGDQGQVTAENGQKLLTIAHTETSPTVISQLASSAKRLPAKQSLTLVRALLDRSEFRNDPHIPLLLWWALERNAVSHTDEVLQVFTRPEDWQNPFLREVILGRLMRRYAGEGSNESLAACARLLATAPEAGERSRMLTELDAGLKMLGRERLPGLPLGPKYGNIAAISRVEQADQATRLKTIPPALAEQLATIWDDQTTDPLIIRVALRLGSDAARDRVLALVTDQKQPEKTRLEMLAILQELGESDECLDTILKLVDKSESEAIQRAALNLLSRFSEERITARLLAQYPQMNADLRSQTRDVLLGRADSAFVFLKAIDAGTYPLTEVSADQLRRVALHNDDRLNELVRKHWGNIRAGTPEEKLAEIRRISNDLRAGSGNLAQGKVLFAKQCATCHKLYEEGKEIGPDLTKANRQDQSFLLVSIVDPNTQIRKEYLNYILVTTNGRILNGLLVEETPASVTLLNAKNERTTVSREDIEELKASPVSLMPEDLLKKLTPQQVRDLFRYLQNSQSSKP